MFTRKLFRLATALALALGLLAPSWGTQPPALNDCNIPQQPVCGG